MAAKQQAYTCSVCGQMVTVVHQGGGRLVCCGRPMTLAGEVAAGQTPTKPAVRTEPVPTPAPAANAPYWKCSNCRYVLQAATPPEVCPSCLQNCQFTDVTCYIPECGFSGTDNRLIAG